MSNSQLPPDSDGAESKQGSGARAASGDLAELQRAHEQVTVFAELARQLTAGSTMREAGRIIAYAAKKLLGWDACLLWLYADESDTVTPMFDIDTIGGEVVEVPVPLIGGKPDGYSLQTIRHGKQLILRTPDEKPSDLIPVFGDETRRSASLMFVPITRNDRVVGVFSIQSYTFNAYTERDLLLLESLGHYCSGALERIKTEAALRESEERYALAALGSNDGLWDWNLNTEKMYFSDRLISMLGYSQNEIASTAEEWFNRVHLQDLPVLKAEIQAHLEGQSEQLNVEHRVMHRDGHYRWILCRGVAVRDPAGKAFRMAGSFTDVSKRKESEDLLARAAFYDALTGLPNRSLFMDRLQRCLARQHRHPEYRFAVLFMDLDRFKMVNDSLGHLAGDNLLRQFGERMLAGVRESDTVARMGGDEFTILLDDHRDLNQVIRIAERLLESLTIPFIIDGTEIYAGASIGITFSTSGYNQVEEILRDADTALYRAKECGKGRFEVFDKQMHESVLAHLDIENGLRTALKRNQFRLVYQPIYSVPDTSIIGFEALLRWDHPQNGIVPPDEFISVAEDTGLIIPIGEWVIRQACHQIADLREQHPRLKGIFVSINISARQFASPGLAALLEEAIEANGIPPESVHVEITETAIIQQPNIVRSVLARWRKMGVRILLDDFGTGFSSLSHLQCFGLDYLKIDRSFINQLQDDVNSQSVVRAVLSLAEVLHLGVVAEGAETANQVRILNGLNCDLMQGYFLSTPVTPEEIAKLLT